MTNRVALNIVFVVGLVFTVSSQESKSSKITHNQSAPILAPEKLEQVQNKIAKIDSHLQAIETKRAFILSSESETQLASRSGWFASMAEIQEHLIAKKTGLINYLKGFNDE